MLFDAPRWTKANGGEYTVESGERTLVQYVALFLEIPLLFGVLYFQLRDQFHLTTHLDALAYSIGAITTAGDPGAPAARLPVSGEWRFLPLGEVLCGFLVGVIVLGRVISVLPPLRGRQ